MAATAMWNFIVSSNVQQEWCEVMSHVYIANLVQVTLSMLR